ncbi:DUF2969 domain-containing protein [Pediococcus argentinicus]|uniref:DUF2969 domain-containing protein n=1 Tax=Pediococcus argentinicus TaxID=480391 RepID=A0A0R2NNG0_9LACO|nr:DUF2969 domain-containing protein [Pediococcus argentinicus]KRO26219.1 hypothetical protein IV88_GL000004 [Pediococcus argentinicus]NKZ23183.1 DUF2969 domain-containing protein [Pediococcus argentinicus]GEP20394.1 hypothetical protein LSA03_17780 [Pediococcus argentinicus]
MSKKAKSFQIEINDSERSGKPVQEVLINNRVIGTVSSEDEKEYLAKINSSEMRVKSLDEGVEWIISEYNLHQL